MSRAALLDADDRAACCNYEYIRDDPERSTIPRWQDGLPPEIVADIRQSLAPLDRLPYFQLAASAPADPRPHKFKQLREAGVILLIGTDSGIPLNFHSRLDLARDSTPGCARLGVDPMDGDPRRDLLAVGGDEGGRRGRHGGAGASARTSSPCAATCCGRWNCCRMWMW